MSKKIAVIVFIIIVIAGIAAYEIIQSLSKPAEEGFLLPTGDKAQTGQPAQTAPQSNQVSQQSSAASASANQLPTDAEIKSAQDKKTMNATITTSLGVIKIELYSGKTPITAANFAKLANAGFYSGIKFHRVIKGFMIQCGDPLTKDDAMQARWGTGGPGYQFADEPFQGQYTRGTLAMANAGPNTNGSQFFIMHQDYPLPANYVIFGKVTQGLDVVDKIADLPTGQNDRPLTPSIIQNIAIDE